MIPVTKTYLPALSDYTSQLERIWDTKWITNRGVLALELEAKLKSVLEVEHLLLMTNGTLPIQIALKNLARGSEVITTPFSYVATTSSIVWEGYTPVFVDIERDHWTIDAAQIENAISDKTAAILATHVFGNPCDVEAINKIATRHNIPVIYDAAHAFGVTYRNQSIFSYGEVSTCSFHATKLFHTGEGGAVIANNAEVFDKLFYSHNFGHDGHENYHGLGINAKISELQAAMGLAVLPYLDIIIQGRKEVVEYYNVLLSKDLEKIVVRDGTKWNYCYYPVLFRDESALLKVEEELLKQDVRARRYFYPSLNTMVYVNAKKMPVSEDVASRILCLPLYVGLENEKIEGIAEIVNRNV